MADLLDQALQEIAAGKARPLYLVHGEEFLARRAAEALCHALVPAQKGVVVIGAAFAAGAGLLTGALAHRRFDGDLRFTFGFTVLGAGVAGGLYALIRSA